MRIIAAAALLMIASACGPRQVEVRSAPSQQAETAIHFTNNSSKTVNVFVNTGSTDVFVRQVAARATEHLPVPGVSRGARVTLKAKPIDGSSGYERADVVMTEMVSWTIP